MNRSSRCWVSFAWLILLATGVSLGGQTVEPAIEFWYGDHQAFGQRGHPQRWINILGHISPADSVGSLSYSLNGSEPRELSFREDKKRIARDGDFNVEIARGDLRPGRNSVTVAATSILGEIVRRTATVTYHQGPKDWPLPYEIDWSTVEAIQDVAQIVDGKWKLTDQGVRSVERYYDRVIAFGDQSWSNYEVVTKITVHALTPPNTGANSTNVTHAAIALRWPGHDADGRQPSVKWYPLGATAEFRLGADVSECRWRVFDGQREFHVESDRRRAIEFEKPYRMKHRVETLPDGQSRYQVKLWPADQVEPASWDLERLEPGDLESGSALLIAHHSDVTFGNVTVVPVEERAANPKE